MTAKRRLLIRLSQWIAGRERSEWTDAMAAEAESASDPASWAFGCVWASLDDRFRRDWWFLAAVLLLPPCATLWKALVFFSTSWLLESHWIPAWLAVGFWILSPFPIVFLFARWRQGICAYIAVAISFALVELIPLLMMWIDLGIPPSAWLRQNFHWYKADPGIVLGAPAGMTLDLLAWLTAAWLGSRFRVLPVKALASQPVL